VLEASSGGTFDTVTLALGVRFITVNGKRYTVTTAANEKRGGAGRNHSHFRARATVAAQCRLVPRRIKVTVPSIRQLPGGLAGATGTRLR
jgi:hypothetical protein